MKITKIIKQKKNPNRVSVFIDDEYSFSLSLNELISAKLVNNQEIDNVRLEQLKKISNDGKVKLRVIEWLFIRPRSKNELLVYLKSKKIDDSLSEQLVDEMQKLKYQNDQEFSKWWVSQRKSQLKSKRQIIYELRQKRVASNIIDEVMFDYDESQILEELIIKKSLIEKYPDRQKFIQYLNQKGFNYSSSLQCYEKLFNQ